jgi:hypothetical protein
VTPRPARVVALWVVTISLVAVASLGLVGCDASFRFDDHDAATTVDTGTTTLDAQGTTWTGIETCATTCLLSCPGPRTCAGECAAACTATCPAGSDCTLSSGRDTTVTCEDARCTATVLDRSVLRCQGAATCNLICPRDCSLDCGAAARCTIQCKTDLAPRTVTGLVTCSEP